MDCARAARQVDANVIADGGIRVPADVAKAIGAGASTVMIGSLLASAAEAPGDVVMRNGQRLKVFRGMASREAATLRRQAEGILDKLQDDFTPEGIESAVHYHGEHAEEIVRHLIAGLRSGMSYTGALTIAEFHERARFTRMSDAGIGESRPHVQARLYKREPAVRDPGQPDHPVTPDQAVPSPIIQTTTSDRNAGRAAARSSQVYAPLMDAARIDNSLRDNLREQVSLATQPPARACQGTPPPRPGSAYAAVRFCTPASQPWIRRWALVAMDLSAARDGAHVACGRRERPRRRR